MCPSWSTWSALRLGAWFALVLGSGCGPNQGAPPSPAPLGERAAALGQALAAEAEPNDLVANATPLGAAFAQSGDVVVRANVFGAGDVDVYSFPALAGDRIYAATMTAFSASGSLDATLELVASDGTTVLESDLDDGSFGPTAASLAATPIPADGTYYLRVSHPLAAGQLRPYDLYVKRQRGAPAAETEPNETVATSQALPASGWVSASLAALTDVDTYAVTLAAGDTIYAALDLAPARALPSDVPEWNGQLAFFDANGFSVVATDPGVAGPDSEALFFTVAKAGTYYLQVAATTGGSVAGDYSLSVAIHAAEIPLAGQACTTYTSVDALPKAIPSGPGSASTTLVVPGHPRIGDLQVLLKLNHTFMPDLDVTLTAPAGNNVNLFTDIGADTGPVMDVTIDDRGALPLGTFNDMRNAVVAPEPAYRLAWFAGEDAGGTWTLTARDDATADGGSIIGFAIRICTPAPATCTNPATQPTTVFTRDFEGNDGGFTHQAQAGGSDEWEYGTPAGTGGNPITRCHGGIGCWKTDLDQNYDPGANADLISPDIDLTTASPPIRIGWALQAQLEQAGADHAWIDVREVGGATPQRVWEHLGATMLDAVGSPPVTLHESAGWGLQSADISAFAGKRVQLVVHLDSDANIAASSNLSGLAIDDLAITHCAHRCGDGFVDPDEACDHGATNGHAGDCCAANCQFIAATTICRAASGACDLPEMCDGAGACPADAKRAEDSACDDGNACTLADACHGGACLGASTVTCAASDACHDAGQCNTTTGLCSDPPKPNGSACTDQSACTTGDHCQSGLCISGVPTVCAPADACHVAGVCDPSTGSCSTPNAPDGDPCNDANACTTADSCVLGACVGSAPVVCMALDACHVPGVCAPATGLCSNPPGPDAAPCDDGSLCTLGDACQAGVCTPASVIACTPTEACHAVGACDPATGLCDDPIAVDGTPCSDDDACTSPDACQSGTCVSAGATVCTAKDDCHLAGICDPNNGGCSNPVAPDDTGCDDHSACTHLDSCQAGTCVGSDAVVCPPPDQCHLAGVCDAQTGLCSNPPAPDGTTCGDGDACTQHDSCQAGVCVGADPVVCHASDQCHAAGSCDPATGDCSDPDAPDGTACGDGDACTRTDTCQAGACVGANPVVCAPLDTCHAAGVCNAATGQCTNPVLAEGANCDDGNPCTNRDLCRAGTCRGEDPVVCAALDACHTAGSCDPATGGCSNPNRPNGFTCNDGDPCTRIDTCKNGSCGGLSPVVCFPLDGCHDAGVCDHQTGQCSNPVSPDGARCDDQDACTRTDTCTGGVCGGAEPIVCTPSDVCHVAGSCNPLNGVCTTPPAPDGTGCDDANACTRVDACQGGRCTGSDAIACDPTDTCHLRGACDPETGTCSNPVAADGAGCNDGNACTQLDICEKGVCRGAHPVSCGPIDGCHSAGTCDRETGTCTQPLAPEGKPCDDGDACTRSDACQAGVCLGQNPIACAARDACHLVGVCDSTTGLCTDPPAGDGLLCDDANACTRVDVCRTGVCQGRQPVVCAPLDVCHVTGVCNPLDGTCSQPPAATDTSCDDGDPCTVDDGCTGGVCGGRDVCSGDDDHDGLSNGDEHTLGTDPAAADTDGDGLPDGTEVEGSGVLAPWGPTDPLDADSDDDGLGDGAEATGNPAGNGAAAGRITDPSDPDTDGDDLWDGLEAGLSAGIEGGATAGGIAFAGSDPALFRPDEDPATTTNPAAADTDEDGLADGIEDLNLDGGVTGLVLGGSGTPGRGETDPRTADTDRDGLRDNDELTTYHTSPVDTDTDDGGATDGDELTNQTDPLDPKDDIPPPPERPRIIGGGACDAGNTVDAGILTLSLLTFAAWAGRVRRSPNASRASHAATKRCCRQARRR